MNQEFKDGGAYAFRKILQGERLNNNQFFGKPIDSTQVYKPAVPMVRFYFLKLLQFFLYFNLLSDSKK